jgi:hypothetical protein
MPTSAGNLIPPGWFNLGMNTIQHVAKAPAMAGPVHSMSQAVRSFWSAVTGHRQLQPPTVLLHDPAARRPHDLDDPFFEEKIQMRMADVIAAAGHKK